MKFLGARAGRVLKALSDVSSYRVLWYCLTDRLIPLGDNGAVGDGPSGEFGIPRDLEVADTSQIPQIVFQTWKSHHVMPDNYRYWRRSFIITNPNFRCLLWDDDDNRRFIDERFPWFRSRYDTYQREIFRADIIRLFFLYVYGGFYADMDSECLRPLDGLRKTGDVLVGQMGYDQSFEHSIPNAIMASKPGQAFWLLAIALVAERLAEFVRTNRDVRPEWLTGPVLLKDTVDLYRAQSPEKIRSRILTALPELEAELSKSQFGKLVILPPPLWYPINWNNFIHTILRKRMFAQNAVVARAGAMKLFPDCFIVTYWSASWK